MTTGEVVTSLSSRAGCPGDGQRLRTCVDRLCSVAGGFHGDAAADPCDERCRDLGSAAKSLLFCFEERPEVWKPWEAGPQGGGGGQCPSRPGGTGCPRGKGVYELPSQPPRGSGTRARRDSAAVSAVAL